MRDINRHEFPNQGWMYRQAQTGWVNPMAMVGFDASVQAIRKHRLANPAITTKHNLTTDPEAIATELEKYTRLRLGIPEPSFFSRGRNSLHSFQGSVVDVAVGIKRAAQGTAVVVDWLGAGGNPVSQELAEKRAAICVACPKNEPGSWYTESPAELIRESVKAWQALKGSNFAFETSQGDKLKSCNVCKCLMRLKVFVPMKHIIEKTPPDIMKEFPSWCWLAKKDA